MPQEMKTLNDIKILSAGISLIVLSLGFSFLGILSFFNRHYDGEAVSCCLNNSFCVAGSVASLVTGAAFLLAACLYWSRDSARAVRPTGTALNKPGRSAEISLSADRFLPDGSACTAAIAVRARARFNLKEYTQDCDADDALSRDPRRVRKFCPSSKGTMPDLG
jgi:hypothetical protein